MNHALTVISNHQVMFPVAFFILAFILDVVYETGGGGADLAQFSYILLIAGFTMALVAAIPGLIEVSGQWVFGARLYSAR